MTLKLDHVSVGYGRAQVLYEVSIEVPAAQVTVLLGRNGAGKSTTMKVVAGLLRATHGRILLNDESIETLPMHTIARKGLGYVPEERRIFTDLTVAENLEVGKQPRREGAPHWTLERVLDLFPKLKELLARNGGQMSGGEQQMLTIARTLMGNPSVLMLDEPSEGLAPVIVERIAEVILRLKREGLAVLLSEQNYHFAKLVSDRAYVLELGHVKFETTMQAMIDDAALRERYLAV